jgi:hypothetical protein
MSTGFEAEQPENLDALAEDDDDMTVTDQDGEDAGES